MSFSFDFVAKPADVAVILDTYPGASHTPASVKEFIRASVVGLAADLVKVHAHGHLFNNDYQVSSCQITVEPMLVAVPNPQ